MQGPHLGEIGWELSQEYPNLFQEPNSIEQITTKYFPFFVVLAINDLSPRV